MKADGLSKAERKALLSDATADDGTDPVDLPVTAVAPAVTPIVTPEALPPAAPDMAALIQMLAAAISQSGAVNAETIKTALADQATMARAPIPETYLTGGYPGLSVYSAPGGDRDQPRTTLRCPMFLGVYTDKGETIPAFEIYEKACTEEERRLLNRLTPGAFPVERNDGARALWRVVDQRDDLGAPLRITIAVPARWLSTDEQAQMPSQRRFLQQLLDGATIAA